MELTAIAAAVNCLTDFCGKRDVAALTRAALTQQTGAPQADVMVLFGASVAEGGDVLARAMDSGVARVYGIVGGAGHTTRTLRDRMHGEYPRMDTDGLPEAEIFARYLQVRYGKTPDFLECRSTNCGNNITNLLALLKERAIPCRSILLCQDPSMQRRMEAGLRRWAPELRCISYAAYRPTVTVRDGVLCFRENIHGMWDMERYVNLLMGEIPRLTDDEQGYGPRGKNFIAHVDIPAPVRQAFDVLRQAYGVQTRPADPRYASC